MDWQRRWSCILTLYVLALYSLTSNVLCSQMFLLSNVLTFKCSYFRMFLLLYVLTFVCSLLYSSYLSRHAPYVLKTSYNISNCSFSYTAPCVFVLNASSNPSNRSCLYAFCSEDVQQHIESHFSLHVINHEAALLAFSCSGQSEDKIEDFRHLACLRYSWRGGTLPAMLFVASVGLFGTVLIIQSCDAFALDCHNES